MSGTTAKYVNTHIINKNVNVKEKTMPNLCFNEMEVWKDDTATAEDEFKYLKLFIT